MHAANPVDRRGRDSRRNHCDTAHDRECAATSVRECLDATRGTRIENAANANNANPAKTSNGR
jgi:hypothetical protein